jgi:hypothetical protein
MKKVNKNTWTKLYVAAGIIDIVQLIIDLTGVGVAINTFADPVIGIGFIVYLNHIGVSVFKHPSRFASMVGVGLLENLTGGIAPAWIADIFYIHHSYKKELAQYEEDEKITQLTSNTRPTMYDGGMRNPESSNTNQNEPLVNNGYRRPQR